MIGEGGSLVFLHRAVMKKEISEFLLEDGDGAADDE